MPRVYIGYDPREDLAYRVCRSSLLAHCAEAHVTPLKQDNLRRAGLYRRAFWSDDGQRYDTIDGRPFSTDFSFSRFLVPMLAVAEDADWALFCDSDFLWRASVADLFALADDRYAVMVVGHVYAPKQTTKLRGGVVQQAYPRKSWSSLMLINARHPQAQMLTTYQANSQPGGWLHGFQWLTDGAIGFLPLEWNWLQGWSDPQAEAKAVHYTLATPDVPGAVVTPWDPEWRAYARAVA
jgi:hypothetical protein